MNVNEFENGVILDKLYQSIYDLGFDSVIW